MGLTFAPDDENGFAQARGVLLTGFESWLGDQRGVAETAATEMAAEAGLALVWKWQCRDGDLGVWNVDDYEDLLLEWCPTSLTIAEANRVTIPQSLAAFAEFMGAEGFLAPGSSAANRLAQTAVELADDFVIAMEGPANPKLPAIVLPDEAEVAASRAAAPILAMFAEMASFVGDGRKLTQKGNLTMADARVLVERLGTGDRVEQVFGDHTFHVKSSAKLFRLRHLFACRPLCHPAADLDRRAKRHRGGCRVGRVQVRVSERRRSGRDAHRRRHRHRRRARACRCRPARRGRPA